MGNLETFSGVVVSASFDSAKRAIRRGEWDKGRASYEASVRDGAVPDAVARLLYAIANIRSVPDTTPEAAGIDASLVCAAEGRTDVRRLLVGPLIREGALEQSIAVLEILVDANPSLMDDRRLLASLLGRMQQWDRAIAESDAAAAIEPHSAALNAARIQLRLQAGQVAAAARVARETLDIVFNQSEEAHVWMLALVRDGDTVTAARVAAMLDPARVPNDRVAAMAVRALAADIRIDAAIRLGEAALAVGHDSAAVRSQLGQAYLNRGGEEDRKVHALKHFAQGVQLAPTDVRIVSLYGETLLRAGRYEDSLEPLRCACELSPGLEHTRALYARALRYSMRYDEAAEQLLNLVEQSPGRARWQRSAVAALSQAGRAEEASELFQRYVARRGAELPDTLEQAMAAMGQRLDTAQIPQARFDWAWSLRRDTANVDRAEWERAVRWGHLVDHLLLDWLECRDDRAEEAMELLGDLEETERFFEPLLATGKGIVVASAHVGPMYAGLVVLELLGIPLRFLSSTPSAMRTSYSSALISTADQTEAQVAKSCIRALLSGYSVCLAVEGAANPAAPRITFEGQEITYSSFASRVAHRLGVPSIFYAPRWENGRVVQTLVRLPDPEPGEDVDTFALRWQRAYLDLLKEYLSGPPENLRMSGGIWRHVKPVDRSSQP